MCGHIRMLAGGQDAGRARPMGGADLVCAAHRVHLLRGVRDYARACTDALVLGTSGRWWGSAEVGEEAVAGGGGRRFDRRTE